MIGFDAKMTAAAGAAYAGLDRVEARRKVLRDLETLGLRRGEKSHLNAVGRCQRCETVLEPLVSLQWFVKTAPLADKAVEATDRGDVKFTPDSWKKTYDEWMRNIRDWCVSRQLWWGHEIPAWYCEEGHVNVPRRARRTPPPAGPAAPDALTQDGDVFDTWFSSWLMPLSVVGWPEKTPDLSRFYPTTVLVTAFDILFFWVARMIMSGVWFDGRAPFSDVVIHGLVRDERGQKMSKTKGNVIDPLEMCDEFGADAVRFALAIQSGTGRDIPFGTSRIAPARAFATKVWNAARFALGMLHEGKPEAAAIDYGALGTVDRWILARLSTAIAKVTSSLESYRFDEAASALYAFFWSEFCDGYVEMAKPVFRDPELSETEKAKTRAVLHRVLLDSLALLHPFMPFVSCEIRDALAGDGDRLPVTPFPKAEPSWDDPLAVQTVETLRAAATRIRNLRAERGLPQTEALDAALEAEGPLAASLERHAPLLVHLARLKSLRVAPKAAIPGAFHDAIGAVGLVVALPVKEMGRRGAAEAREGARGRRARRRIAPEEARRRGVPREGASGGRREEPQAAGRAGGAPRPALRKSRRGGGMTAPFRSPLGARAPLGGRRFPFLENIVFVDTVGSTNDLGKSVAEKLLADGTEIGPTALVSRRQTAGRGRGGGGGFRRTTPLSRSRFFCPGRRGPSASGSRSGSASPWRAASRRGSGWTSASSGRTISSSAEGSWAESSSRRGASDEEGYAVAGIGLNVGASREALDAAGLKDAVSLAVAGAPAGLLEGEGPLVALLESIDAGLESPRRRSRGRVRSRLGASEGGDAHGRRRRPGNEGEIRRRHGGRVPEARTRRSGVETVVSGEIASF